MVKSYLALFPYLIPQSTYIPRVPLNWDPFPQAIVSPPPPEPKGGGGYARLRAGGLSPNSDDWRKSLALCLLCGLFYEVYPIRGLASRILNVFLNRYRLDHSEPVFLNIYGAQESIPRNEFRQPM
jgi:hypothetical protein